MSAPSDARPHISVPAACLNRDCVVYSSTCPLPLMADNSTVDAENFWERASDMPVLIYNAQEHLPKAMSDFINEHMLTDDAIRKSPLRHLQGATRVSGCKDQNLERSETYEGPLSKWFGRTNAQRASLIFVSAAFTSAQCTPGRTRGGDLSALAQLPSFLRYRDILSLERTTPAGLSPNFTQLIAGMADTYTASHIDGLGVTAASYMIEGEKLWIYARPEHADEFYAIFPNDRCPALGQLKQRYGEQMERLGVGAVRHTAGSYLIIPAGWPHLVIHLTPTWMISTGLLRPNKLRLLENHIRERFENNVFDLPSTMGAFVQHAGEFGFTQAEATDWQKRICKPASRQATKKRKPEE
jgi:hypothetical protein